ncbi:DUF4229 domain-containing protein [Phytoactinopolyspora alkaliphila]|uniref:DUF4229 domain-containing protein n=1 Tax=Phytoactinopolyspora alkaliphila TaxID=1783498 RepID=A0A6N9YHQ8_9ACTN|nr:DUF4229 domain-containing protein [Phytoactinopolyspora alkaliphila]NED94533.1 DUF4229 domain-containing protein [Phytoactinopolyspora alkaliphila]
MAVLRYTLLRALILVVVGSLAWLLGFRGFWLLFVAVFVSGLVSIFVLRASRDQVSATLDRRLATINQRLQHRTAAEDAWDEAQRRAEADDVPRSGPGGRHGAEQGPGPKEDGHPSSP